MLALWLRVVAQVQAPERAPVEHAAAPVQAWEPHAAALARGRALAQVVPLAAWRGDHLGHALPRLLP